MLGMDVRHDRLDAAPPQPGDHRGGRLLGVPHALVTGPDDPGDLRRQQLCLQAHRGLDGAHGPAVGPWAPDRKSTRLNSSHVAISYAVFCLKKKTHHAKIHVEIHTDDTRTQDRLEYIA